ncbi:MAG: hypothetical protein A2W91_12150 [Bacteroidetes bacterium GWF2_38_335]|nr:MAG: hypothetical protein A2W91_12150 [Bacteroidetes bacterium GWF2_38_335]OFY76924.1 MAG: hypothetical protein A2281_00265 [Bacteroidetes bacterium RIFOXYA12_FULL_38_20]HBS86774.1 hypothetical protein [Bacteroidales bacterium]
MIEINHLNDGNFSDLSFEITEIKKDFLGDYEILAAAMFNKEKAGFKLIIKSKLKPGISEGKILSDKAVKGGVQIKSTGKESDHFVQAAAHFFQQIAVKPFTIKSVVADAIALTGKDFDITKEKVSLLLKFDPENKKSGLSEFFLDLDIPGKMLHLKEKDHQWRANFLKLLTT